MRRSSPSTLLTLACALLALTACTLGAPLPPRDEIADAIRVDVAEVADILGTDVEVHIDQWAPCSVEMPPVGERYRYLVHLHSHYDTFEEIMQEAWPQLEAAGWELVDDPPDPGFFRFRRDGQGLLANFDGLTREGNKFVLTGGTDCLRGLPD